MKMLPYIHRAIPLAIFLATLLVLYVEPASAYLWHDSACNLWLRVPNNGVEVVYRVDILYPGTPQLGIFMNVGLYAPFTYYETDGESYLYIYPSEPVGFSTRIVTFETILDWGVLGGPTPFTFVEYDVSGPTCSGVIYNGAGDGGVIVPIDKFGLLAPYIGLGSTIVVATAATAICIKRVKHRKER